MPGQFNDLPDGWALPTVAEVGSIRLGRQRSPDKHTGRYSTKYLRAANITPNGLALTDLLEMDFTPKERATYALLSGDVVLTEASGSPSQVGRAAVWNGEIPDCCFQNTVIRFRPHATTTQYALLTFRHYAASGILAQAARGVGIQHLGASRFASLQFPLPPLNEQRRIAALVDNRLGAIREAEVSLQSALEHTEKQDREIFAAAVTGKLVEPDIVSGRSETQPAQHARSSFGKSLARSTRQGSLFDAAQIEAADGETVLPPLPPGWRWARIDEIGEVTLGRQRSPQHRQGANMRPYLRVANVFENRIDTSDVLRMNFTPSEYSIYALKYGDILLNEGQSPELVGRPAVYRDEVPGACFQNTLVRFRAGPAVNVDFALLLFRHYLHSGEFQKIARWSTNIAHLGLERFRAMPFPLPPLSEQELIAADAQRRLERSVQQRATISSSLGRLPEMEHELFAAAVSGELVPQEKTDEPATALLARVGPPPQDVLYSEHSSPQKGESAVTTRRRSKSRSGSAAIKLEEVLREARRPMPVQDLFALAGYDRDQPEHIELFYLALRAELGRSIRQVGGDIENAMVEAIDAA